MVVGAGNSAAQVAAELANVARVSLASRGPVRWFPQKPLGRDLHFWLYATGLDTAPFGRFQRRPATMSVIDDGPYRAALAAGRPDRRPLFTRIDGPTVTWADSAKEDVDATILATDYVLDLGYLALSGALDEAGRPRHHHGASSSASPTSGWNGSEACLPHPCEVSAAMLGGPPGD